MTYNKFIRYGETFELYEYEKEPRAMAKRTGRKRKESADNKSVRASGSDPLSERELGKRRDNAKRAAMAFRRLVASNLTRSNPPLLLTLTYAENVTDISVGYKDYRSFVQALRYKFGKVFKYVCVPEFQRRGAVHFHCLFWGLPAELVVHERETRTIALMWGKGYVSVQNTDGDGKLSSYLAKYMSKAFTDARLRHQKAYVASRNVSRPTIAKGFSPLWPILDEYVGNDSLTIRDDTYWSKWLGTCRHRIFKIAPDSQE